MASEPTPLGGEWKSVRLTEARQVTALMGYDSDSWPAPEVAVVAHYQALRAAGRRSGALDYLAHALPRLELVAWAARVLEDEARKHPPAPAARHALDVALRWVGEPNDLHRRAAREAAEPVSREAPERYLGFAVFYSGGSIAEPEQAPVMPPEHAAARNVVTALSQAAVRSEDEPSMIDRALDIGEAVAQRGVVALTR